MDSNHELQIFHICALSEVALNLTTLTRERRQEFVFVLSYPAVLKRNLKNIVRINFDLSTGIEPATLCLQDKCSNQMSYDEILYLTIKSTVARSRFELLTSD